MAKGNDGHLLQHAVEAELAFTLFNWGGGKGLYVILTHGMRPFEHFEEPRGGPRKLLDDKLALCLSTDTIAENAPRILSSYRLPEDFGSVLPELRRDHCVRHKPQPVERDRHRERRLLPQT